MLQRIQINTFRTLQGVCFEKLSLTYEVFGQPLERAPVVLVNHALTGNSSVCGEDGWWKGLIGKGKCIDTDKYAILSFNIPGNGYQEEENKIEDYKAFVARDVAAIFLEGLQRLGVGELYAVIGGSVGGGIAWELAVLAPKLIRHLVPIASDWKSTDWLKATCLVQEQILLHSNNPVHDARLHAMLVYRTPESFSQKFERSFNEEKGMYNIESWLFHHGKKLESRFGLSSYKALNHILANIDITKDRGAFEEVIKDVECAIHQISVDSDLFFTAKENKDTFEILKKHNPKHTYGVVKSVHGHDAFFIEYDQLHQLLKHVF